jgi:hypothetical protein
VPEALRNSVPEGTTEITLRWSESDIAEAARTHTQLELHNAALQRIDDHSSADEQAKTLATLVNILGLIQAAGAPHEAQARLINVINGMDSVRSGHPEPLFEPPTASKKNIDHRKTPKRVYTFIADCVVAAEARKAWKKETIEDAQREFLRAFSTAIPAPPGSLAEKRLFPVRKGSVDRPNDDEELERRRELLQEWSKPNTHVGWDTPFATANLKMVRGLLAELGPNDPEAAYETIFAQAVKQAKSLI